MITDKTNSRNRPFFSTQRWLVIAAAITAFSANALAAGEETYKAKCAGCHGPDGSGATAIGKKFKLRDLRSPDVQKQSDADLQSIIAAGKPPMPAFGKTLGDAKVQELVAYMRSIASK